MDINTLRGISTILVMIAFIGICLWAYSSSRKDRFEEDANLPFQDDEIDQRTLKETEKRP
jgi:cytochrome c oxidase cbb3-type subunit 4